MAFHPVLTIDEVLDLALESAEVHGREQPLAA